MADHDYAKLQEPRKKKTLSRGRQCAAYGCNTYQYHINESGERVLSNIPMYRIPEEKKAKDDWCRLVKRVDGRDGFKVGDGTRVCKRHFRDCDFELNGNKLIKLKIARPVLHSWNDFTFKEPRRLLVRQQSDTVVNPEFPEIPEMHEIPEIQEIPEIHALPELHHDDDDFVRYDFVNHDWVPPAFDSSVIIDDSIPSTDDVVITSEKSVEDYKTEIVHLKARIVELEIEVETLKWEKTETVRDKFVNHVMSKDDACSHATGFHSVGRLKKFYNFLDPGENGENVLMYRSQEKTCERRPRVLSPFEGFLILLCRLRSGFSIKHLCFLFCVSTGSVDAHFIMWLSFVYFKVASISWWPSKQTVIDKMPASMKEKFPSVRVIIDCTEFPAENPSSLKTQKLLYSSYKSRVTVKSLVGIMPGGGFTFVSSGYPGSISDREIVIKSGLLNPAFYEIGDSWRIMADRGFTILDLLEPMGVNLIIPSFLSGRDQLSEEETVTTQQIAAERIHVERAIQRLKGYQILDLVPVTLYDNINQIITVCACLSNMQNPIIAE